jgi:hypothetical protein
MMSSQDVISMGIEEGAPSGGPSYSSAIAKTPMASS